jgi:uncharacterized protein (DUF2249 family)
MSLDSKHHVRHVATTNNLNSTVDRLAAFSSRPIGTQSSNSTSIPNFQTPPGPIPTPTGSYAWPTEILGAEDHTPRNLIFSTPTATSNPYAWSTEIQGAVDHTPRNIISSTSTATSNPYAWSTEIRGAVDHTPRNLISSTPTATSNPYAWATEALGAVDQTPRNVISSTPTATSNPYAWPSEIRGAVDRTPRNLISSTPTATSNPYAWATEVLGAVDHTPRNLISSTPPFPRAHTVPVNEDAGLSKKTTSSESKDTTMGEETNFTRSEWAMSMKKGADQEATYATTIPMVSEANAGLQEQITALQARVINLELENTSLRTLVAAIEQRARLGTGAKLRMMKKRQERSAEQKKNEGVPDKHAENDG